MEDNTYENVTSCLAKDLIRETYLQTRSKTDADIDVSTHIYDVPRRLQHRSRSLTALNTFATHHQINMGSRAGSSSPLSDKSVEFHSAGVTNITASRRGWLTPAGIDEVDCSASPLDSMCSRDKSIYNSLGTSSSKEGKPSYALLGLTKNVIKTGIMSKTGPSPSWCAKWNRRVFVLKGNFLFYFDPVDKPIQSAPVLGGVYIKNAMIERISLAFTKRILRITPQVARRSGWDKHNHTEAFYIKFRSEEGRDEWYDVLTKVSTGRLESPQL